MTFDRAFSTARWTLPSHFSLFTGLYLHDMPADLADMRPPLVGSDHPHIAEVLRERGYATAGFVANMSYTIDETGLNRGFILWDDHSASLGQIGISTAPGRAILNSAWLRRLLDWHEVPTRKHALRVNAAMLDWLDEHRDRPFFVFANYFDAHSPYLPPEEFAARFATRRPEVPLRYNPHSVMWVDETNHTPEEFAAERDMYDGALAWLDSELGRLFEALDSRGLLDNTLVVVGRITEIPSVRMEPGPRQGRIRRVGARPPVTDIVPRAHAGRRATRGGARTLGTSPRRSSISSASNKPPARTVAATAWDATHSARAGIAKTSPQQKRLDPSPACCWTSGTPAPRGRHGRVGRSGRHPAEQNDLAADLASAAQLVNIRSAFERANAIAPAQRSLATFPSTPALTGRSAPNR